MQVTEYMLSNNQLFADKYIKQSKFFNQITHHSIDEEKIDRIFACISILAAHFQKMVLSRCLFHRTPVLQSISKKHLMEEIGHDDFLRSSLREKNFDDTLLEACCTWFSYKMIFEDDVKGSMLMHFVVEKAADIIMPVFVQMLTKTLGENNKYAKYVVLHEHLDCNHSELLNPVIEKLNLSETDTQNLLQEIEKGWKLMNVFFERVNEIVFETNQENNTKIQ